MMLIFFINASTARHLTNPTDNSVVNEDTVYLLMVKIVPMLMNVLTHPVSMVACAEILIVEKDFIASVQKASRVKCAMHSNKKKL